MNDKVYKESTSHYVAYYGLHSQRASVSDNVVSRE